MNRSQITSPRKSPARCGILLAMLAGLLLQSPGFAATLPDLYAAQVPVTETSSAGLDAAFADALALVMVKLTGQRNLPADPAVRAIIANATPLVSQYQVAGAGTLRVHFDRAALWRRLDAARLPVWADERPRTLVLLEAPAVAAELAAVPAADPLAADMQLVLDTASSRGLPVALSRQVEAVPGMAGDPLELARAEAARVGADLVLVGQRLPVSGLAAWRWTLLDGTERSEWQGDAAEGVHRVADKLAARYAVAAAASSRLRLEVQGIGSFADYGRLQAALGSLGVIETLAVASLRDDTIVYELLVRGDAARLRDALALQAVLEPVVAEDGIAVGAAGLVYRLAGAP
jgi:hypothetical protein